MRNECIVELGVNFCIPKAMKIVLNCTTSFFESSMGPNYNLVLG